MRKHQERFGGVEKPKAATECAEAYWPATINAARRHGAATEAFRRPGQGDAGR